LTEQSLCVRAATSPHLHQNGSDFLFFRHHQAHLMGDRDYRAEFSAGFPDSIAIVVVKRTAILF
jgi:hypothetical protein